MRDTEYKFYALAPINDADIRVYESALDFVFENDDVRNVAISGSYGAGKSSILASYKNKHTNKKFLHISLAHFRSASGSEDSTHEDTEKSTETILEGKILNQLIHQIAPERIPCTNFRVKKETSKKRNIITAILAAIGTLLGLYIFLFTQWTTFVQSLTADWLKNLLWFSEQSESRLVAGLCFYAIIGMFVYLLVKLQESRHIIKRADVSGVEIEIFEDSNESYFDKYLNEVLYLFEKSDVDVIVFEDIDRYDLSRIFERLHEINRLVNNNLINANKKPLRFFYLMRDDIFVSKDRTKFFDFIIPIVPVVDGSNSFNKFLECFQKSGLIEGEKASIDLEFLQGLSLYIDDMRILQNICNEFLVYNGRLSTTEQDPNKMLSLISIKNLFPRDFADLQLGRGFIFEVIGGHGKERLIASERTKLQNFINVKNDELIAVNNEKLFSDEITVVYINKLVDALPNHGISRDPRNSKRYFDQWRTNNNTKSIVEEYDRRMGFSTINDNAHNQRISDLEKGISDLKSELVKLTGLRLKDIITRTNIKALFEASFKSETGNNDDDFSQIKDSPYFDLLKYLVREGFIDETYSDYMTYFYENSLTRTDKVFLRSITDKRAKEPTYTLDNPQMVVSRIPVAYFEQEEILNYSLFDYLLSDFTSERIFADKTKRLFRQITENQCFDFLLGYSENNVSDNFVKALGTEWRSFFSDFFSKLNIGDAPTEPKIKNDIFITRYAYVLLTLIGETSQRISYLDEPSKELLINFLSNDASFLAADDCDDQNVALGIKSLGIYFKMFTTETARLSLLKLVYNNNSYIINYVNIETMVTTFYSNADISTLQTASFSVIMSETDSPLAKYIATNIDAYVEVVLAECSGVITDAPDNAILLLNNPDVVTEKKIIYISYLKTTIKNLFDVEDGKLWSALLENPIAIDYSAANVVAYFSMRCEDVFDDTLVQYINSKGTTVIDDDCFEKEDSRNAFFMATIKSVNLSNSIYESYLEQFKLCYSNFAIEGLPMDKISIIDKLNIIKISKEVIMFMRKNYDDYLYTFIVNHISNYIAVVAEPSVFLREEMLELLNSEISDADKISLIDLEAAPISIKEKLYSDTVTTHILQSNYDVGDFDDMIESYSSFGMLTKSIILEKATDQIGNIIRILNRVDRQLITALFLSDRVAAQNKQTIFKTLATTATDDEIKQWLHCVEGDEFLELYDENKRPRFENNEWSKSLLEIFKNRKLIKEYGLSESFGKFTITRWSKSDAR